MKVCSYSCIINNSKSNTKIPQIAINSAFCGSVNIPLSGVNVKKSVFAKLFSGIKGLVYPNMQIGDLSKLSFSELKNFCQGHKVTKLDSSYFISQNRNVISYNDLKDGFYKIRDNFFPDIDTVIELKNSKIKQKIHLIPPEKSKVNLNAFLVQFEENGKYKITNFKRDGSKSIIA